ncbi:hypothetical protein D3C72_1885120 [compost metagenome]
MNEVAVNAAAIAVARIARMMMASTKVCNKLVRPAVASASSSATIKSQSVPATGWA